MDNIDTRKDNDAIERLAAHSQSESFSTVLEEVKGGILEYAGTRSTR